MKCQGHKAAHLFFTMIASCALLCATDIASAKGRIHDGGPVMVSAHIRSNGTYVAPHLRSAPDNSKANNLAQTHPATGAKLGNGQNEAQTYDDVKKQLADARAKDNKHPAR